MMEINPKTGKPFSVSGLAYRTNPARRAYLKRYNSRPKRKAYMRKWRTSQNGKKLVCAQSRRYHNKLRQSVLQAYGGDHPHCVCECGCRVTKPEWLTIDHINGGGNAHRREVGNSATAVYRWLRSRHYPASFRILCFNCNCGCKKRVDAFPGYCYDGCTVETGHTRAVIRSGHSRGLQSVQSRHV